jgi:hypothetical protein
MDGFSKEVNHCKLLKLPVTYWFLFSILFSSDSDQFVCYWGNILSMSVESLPTPAEGNQFPWAQIRD